MCCFFFSSRRRHTRYWRDWSSDVCSSDLAARRPGAGSAVLPGDGAGRGPGCGHGQPAGPAGGQPGQLAVQIGRASCRERVEISVVAVSLKKKIEVKIQVITPEYIILYVRY